MLQHRMLCPRLRRHGCQDRLNRLHHRGWCSPFRLRRLPIDVYRLRRPAFLFAFALRREEVKVREAVPRARRVHDVDGRCGEPENFVRFGIAVEMFCYGEYRCQHLNRTSVRRTGEHALVSGGSFSATAFPPNAVAPPAAVIMLLSGPLLLAPAPAGCADDALPTAPACDGAYVWYAGGV